MKRAVFALAVATAILCSPSVAIAAASSGAPAKTIPYKKEETEAAAVSGQAFVIVTVLLGLACAGLVVARRYFPRMLDLKLPLKPGASRRLQLVEKMRLDARTSLYLVQLDDRVLLLAQSGDNVTPIVNERAGDGTRIQKVESHA